MRLLKLLTLVANEHVTGSRGDVRRCPEPTAGILVALGLAEYLDDGQDDEQEPDQPLDSDYTSPKFQSFIEEHDQHNREYQQRRLMELAEAIDAVPLPTFEPVEPKTKVNVTLSLNVNLNGSPFANCPQYKWSDNA